MAIEHSDPAQRQTQILRGAEQNVGEDFQFLQVDVGLVEAVEQHQRICPGLFQLVGHVRHVTEVGTELDRQRDCHRRAHCFHDRDVLCLDLGPGLMQIAGDVVEVEFQRVGPGFGNEFGEVDPAAQRRAVQAGDDGNIDRVFGLTDVLEIALRPDMEGLRFREVAQRFRVAFGASGHVMVQLELFVRDLLFEQGVNHHRCCAHVLHALDVEQPFRQRRCRCHQGAAQGLAQISRRQIHC